MGRPGATTQGASADRISLFDRFREKDLDPVLDKLDVADPNMAVKEGARTRWRYRRRLKVALADESGKHAVHVVYSRAVNATDVWFIAPSLMYPGRTCRVEMVTTHSTWSDLNGVVAACRYIGARLYEAHVRLVSPLELVLYAPDAVARQVLLVDDEPTSRKLLALMLERLNAHVTAVSSGAEALSEAESGSFDLVLLDLDMPEMDGFETLERLRASGFSETCIAASSHEASTVRERCAAAGFDGYLAKPFEREDVEQVLRQRVEPLFSSISGDEQMSPLIQSFVDGLRDRCQALLDAVGNEELTALEQALRSLRADAGGCGFEPIATRTGSVLKSIHDQVDVADVKRMTTELVKLCRQVRVMRASGESEPARQTGAEPKAH